jgi:hypothetical protein
MPAPHRRDRRKFLTPRTVLKFLQRRGGGFGVLGTVDVLSSAARTALLSKICNFCRAAVFWWYKAGAFLARAVGTTSGRDRSQEEIEHAKAAVDDCNLRTSHHRQRPWLY